MATVGSTFRACQLSANMSGMVGMSAGPVSYIANQAIGLWGQTSSSLGLEKFSFQITGPLTNPDASRYFAEKIDDPTPAVQSVPTVDQCTMEGLMREFNIHVETNFREMFPDIDVMPAEIFEEDIPSNPTIGILHSGEIDTIVEAAYGAREHPDANWLLIPFIYPCLSIQSDMLFASAGIFFKWKTQNQLELQVINQASSLKPDCLSSRASLSRKHHEILRTSGFPISSSPVTRELANDKARSHELFKGLEIKIPRHKLLHGDGPPSSEQLEASIKQFLKNVGAPSFVIKPNNASLGAGVAMFNTDEIPDAVEHASELARIGNTLLLEERIKSYQFMLDGKRQDWNIRVVIPHGDLKGWRIEDTTEVRYDEFNGKPVNKSKGANIVDIEEGFEMIGFTKEQREKIVAELYLISNAVRDRLAEYDAELPLIGIDVIVDEDLKSVLLEVNAGHVGGIKSLIEARKGKAKFRAVEQIVRNLFHGAQESRRFQQVPVASSEGKEHVEPRDKLDWSILGVFLFNIRKYDSALHCFDKCLEIDPNDTHMHSNKGGALVMLRRHEEALKALEMALEIDPSNITALRNMNWALDGLRRYEEMIGFYYRVLDIEPNDAFALEALYRHYFINGRYEEMIGFANRILKFDPYNVDKLYEKGLVLVELDRPEEAITVFDIVLEIDPSHTSAKTNKSKAYRMIENTISDASEKASQ